MKKLIVLTVLCLTLSANAHEWCNDDIEESTPDSRFDVTAGTATDKQTGLTWMRCSVGQSGSGCTGSLIVHTWEEALKAPATANAGNGTFGHKDWRLPNIKELASILEIKCAYPAINTRIFTNAPINSVYWSSTPGLSSNVWKMSYNSGSIFRGKVDVSSGYVRLVRGGQ